jgi:hypothetical protein
MIYYCNRILKYNINNTIVGGHWESDHLQWCIKIGQLCCVPFSSKFTDLHTIWPGYKILEGRELPKTFHAHTQNLTACDRIQQKILHSANWILYLSQAEDILKNNIWFSLMCKNVCKLSAWETIFLSLSVVYNVQSKWN